ncbi:hypothetical protein KJ059_08330 [Myxococcota bacterium]|nr:hypothetical protein [Myxococcota bacterium]MCZ7619929.1 hypothetical protein [Myxococcota bacterium]
MARRKALVETEARVQHEEPDESRSLATRLCEQLGERDMLRGQRVDG